MAEKTPNNQAILNLAVQGKSLYVMSEDDPNNKDPIARRKLAALYGEGNIVVLPRTEFLKYLGGEDIISILASESRDPLYNYEEFGEDFVPEIFSTLPPPVDLKVIDKPRFNSNGEVTVKVQFFGPTIINNKTVSYEAQLIEPISRPATRISRLTATAFYPLVTINFDTVPDASKYLVKLIATSDPTGKTFSGKVHVPPIGDARTTFTFSTVPRGTYKVSVIPYNESGISGFEAFCATTTAPVSKISDAKVITV